METIGIAFELPFISEEEREVAAKLTKLYQGMVTEDIRNYLEQVTHLVKPAGLYVSNGKNHLWIARCADRDSEQVVVNIPRWAIICEEGVAKSWQRIADFKGVESVAPINNSTQTDNDMNFFQQLAEMSQGLDLTIRVNEKNGILTIEVLPGNIDTLRPVRLKGSPKDVDEGIIEAIRKPLEMVKGLQVDTSDFENSVNKGLDRSVTKNNAKASVKPAVKTEGKPPAKKAGSVKPNATNKKKAEKPGTIPPEQEAPFAAGQQPEIKKEEEVAASTPITKEEPKAEERAQAPIAPEAPKVDDAPKKPVELSIF